MRGKRAWKSGLSTVAVTLVSLPTEAHLCRRQWLFSAVDICNTALRELDPADIRGCFCNVDYHIAIHVYASGDTWEVVHHATSIVSEVGIRQGLENKSSHWHRRSLCNIDEELFECLSIRGQWPGIVAWRDDHDAVCSTCSALLRDFNAFACAECTGTGYDGDMGKIAGIEGFSGGQYEGAAF